MQAERSKMKQDQQMASSQHDLAMNRLKDDFEAERN